jgi:hypothetical protein
MARRRCSVTVLSTFFLSLGQRQLAEYARLDDTTSPPCLDAFMQDAVNSAGLVPVGMVSDQTVALSLAEDGGKRS